MVTLRERIGVGLADPVFERAAQVVQAREYALSTCNSVRSFLQTEWANRADVPCGTSTCLARQYVAVTVGWRAVKLTIRREVWDASLRDWVLARDPASVSDVEREANALVRELKLSDFDDDAHYRPDPTLENACQRASLCAYGGCKGNH